MGVYLYSKLPSEYQEVEYVQSSGTQYIDTGYIATANTKFYIKASTKGESGHTGLFGSRSLSATNPFLSYIELSYNSTPNVIRVDVNNITGDTGYRWVIDTPFEIEIDAPNKKVSVDGNQISRYDNFTATFSSVTLSLFAMHGGTNGVMKYNYPIVGRIYGCKIWDSGTLVRDFVPCYRKLDSVIGMYDFANGVFYTNSGSGTFTKGADVDRSHEYPLKNAYIGEYKRKSGIYHNATLGLISISDGQTGITITDKNLGATQVYNVGDTLSSSNCGYMYQRGNNYGFSSIGTISTNTNIAVNTSSYSWQNPYSGSPFIVWTSGSPDDWSSNDNPDLWGDTTNTKEARKGPCPDGFHIATQSERGSLITTMTALGISTSQGNKYQQYLKIPFAGYRKYSSGGSVSNQGTWACLWSTTTFNNQYNSRKAYDLWITSSVADNTDNSMRAGGLNIRPMKNEPVIPDDTRTVLYQPN